MSKTCVVLMMLLVTPTFAQTKLDYTVEEAIEVLQTSLNSQQRSNALYALRVAREKAAPAANVLARIIAQAPTSAEANYAAESLARIGEPAVPLIASLSQNGLDWSILFARHTFAVPNDLDEAFLKELNEREQGRVAEERLDDRSFFDPKSDKPPADAFVQATNFKFFYPPMNDKRFRSKKLFAVAMPDELAPDFEQVFLSAQDGELDAAKAKQPFLLIGWLPGGGHPSKISHRVMECSIDGRSIECDLEFTYHVIPGTGPGIPSKVFVAAKMPALPAGEYSIRFQIVKSWFERGDGLMRADPKRDMLETEPYHTTFVVGE